MEHHFHSPFAETLPPHVERFMSGKLERSEPGELVNYVFDQYRAAFSFNLVATIVDYSEYFDIDDEVTKGLGPRAFSQGMLFGLAVARDWLEEADIHIAYKSVSSIDKELRDAGNESLADDQEHPLWDDVLLEYGANGIHLVSGYGLLVEACALKMLPDDQLHPYFRAGAGLMMRIITARRLAERKKEVVELEEVLEKSEDLAAKEERAVLEQWLDNSQGPVVKNGWRLIVTQTIETSTDPSQNDSD